MNINWQKAPRLGGFLFLSTGLAIYLLVSNRSGFGTGFAWHDEQRWAQLWLFFGGLIFAALFSNPRISLLGVLGFCLVLVCSARSQYPGWALAEVALYCGMAAMAWIVARVRRQAPIRFDQAAGGVVLLLCLSYLWGFFLVYSLQLGYGEDLEIRDLFSGYSNRRFFSQTQALTLPLLMLPLMERNFPPAIRRLTIVVAMAWWSLAFLVGTRAVWLALASVVVWSWCRWGNIGRLWARQQAIAAIGGGLLFWVGFVFLPQLMGISLISDNSRLIGWNSATDSSGRVMIWRASLHMIGEHPWLGSGAMHFAIAPGGPVAHPHNLMLQLAVEWGIPLALAGGVAILLGIRSLQSNPSGTEANSAVRICLASAILSGLGVAMFDGIAVMPYSQVLLAGIIGWSWGVVLPPKSLEESPTFRLAWWWRSLWRGGAFLLALYLAWLAYQAEERLVAHNDVYIIEQPDQPFKPRFWLQGIIGFPWDERYPAPWFKASVQSNAERLQNSDR